MWLLFFFEFSFTFYAMQIVTYLLCVEKHIPLEVEDTIDSIAEISAVCNTTEDLNNNHLTSKRKKHNKNRNRSSTGDDNPRKNTLRKISQADNNNLESATNKSTAAAPNLIPIQTFSFLKWNINVDTLVRLFIIA
jgi:hypothetical protein